MLSMEEDAIHYQAVRARDPHFHNLCRDYTRLAARFKQKEQMAVQITLQ